MAKIYGQLEKAQLENTTSDTASHPKGMITYRTDLNQAKVSNGTTYKLLIDEDSTQTLSNKTYASPSITGAITAAQTTTPANPASGSNKLYFKADGKLYTLDSSGNEAMVGSGTGGVKNLITNGNADDTSSSIFVPYADAASTRPVDGTGGSPTVTTSMTTSTPLDGVKSFLLTKPASNVQGQGWAVPFSVDPAYRAKSLKISVDYIVNSGTFVAGSNGASPTDGDLIWTIYDVTNSAIIEPSNIKMFSQSSTISDKFEATFQTSATGASYRLIAHVASTSALAFELKVDNITVSPSNYVYGTPVTDYTPVTMTLTNAGNATVAARMARIGDTARICGTITIGSSAPTGPITLNMPSGFSIDTTKTAGLSVGVASGSNSGGTASYTGTVRVDTATSMLFYGDSNNGIWNATVPHTWLTLWRIDFTIHVAIVGWSSSVQMSDSADTRVVAARYTTTNTTSLANATFTMIDFGTKSYDTHGAVTGAGGGNNTTPGSGWRYIVPVSGIYRVSLACGVTSGGGWNTGESVILSVYKNSGEYERLGRTFAQVAHSQSMLANGSTTISCVAGDVLQGAFYQDSGAALNMNGSSQYIDIERLSGPSAIAASESVNAKYTTTAGSSFTDGATAIVDFGTKEFDSHSAVTTGGSWKFTAPVSGVYTINGHIGFSIPSSTRYQIVALLRKNGTETNRCVISTTQNSANGSAGLPFTFMLKLNAGDYIDLQTYQDSGASRTLLTTAGLNAINIARIGN